MSRRRIVEVIVMLALMATVGMLVLQFLNEDLPLEEPAASTPESTPPSVQLEVAGWHVRQSAGEGDADALDASRLERFRGIARAARTIPLPLETDRIERGFLESGVAWERRERYGRAELRISGDSACTLAVFVVESADPAGERVIAWSTRLPAGTSGGGQIQILETVRPPAAEPASLPDLSIEPDPTTEK